VIKELIKLCNHFDKLGLIKEADYLDSVIKNSSYQDRMIDAGGISSEDFYDDPEFAEDYQSGVYDITCPQCSGKRVEPIVDESRLDDEQKAAMEHMEEAAREEEYDRRTRMAESGYGW